MLRSQPEQAGTILRDVIAIKQTFTLLWHYRSKSKLTIQKRQVACILAIAESRLLLLVIRLWVFMMSAVSRVD